MAKRTVYASEERRPVCVVEEMDKAVQILMMNGGDKRLKGKLFDNNEACREYIEKLHREQEIQGFRVIGKEDVPDFELDEIDIMDEEIKEHRQKLQAVFIALCREDFAWECYLAIKAMLDKLKREGKKTAVISVITSVCNNAFEFATKELEFDNDDPGMGDIYFTWTNKPLAGQDIYFAYSSKHIKKFHKLCNKLGYSKRKESCAALSDALERLDAEQALNAVMENGNLEILANYNYDPSGDWDVVYKRS